jgi:hypothetical protein
MGGGGGGIYFEKTAQGIVAAGSVYNPNYGEMAADSIAKEIEERKLVPATARTQDAASGEDLVSPANGMDELTPGADEVAAFASDP